MSGGHLGKEAHHGGLQRRTTLELTRVDRDHPGDRRHRRTRPRQAGADLVDILDRAGWPFFVIVPGLGLLATAIVAARPQGLGFAIAGSIVTTVGLILLYQQSTGHWESWAYVWALIPGSSGLAMTVYGSAVGRRDLVTAGLRMVAVAAALPVAGFWFFETIFDTGRAPIDLGRWWPLVLIGLGLLIALDQWPGGDRRANGRRRPNLDL